MKLATVSLGDKNYQAAHLDAAESADVTRALADMEKATAEDDFGGVAKTIEALKQILLKALQDANSQIAAEQLEAAAPREVMIAIGQLNTASLQAVA